MHTAREIGHFPEIDGLHQIIGKDSQGTRRSR
jgi:hypothetical protein